jgi:predicted ATPase/DNA-binding XRE family transcriptional regulator
MENKMPFGNWLRKQRRALDLSQAAFADHVGCAEITLRRIEAGRLKPSKELAGVILEQLGIPEKERLQWISFARGLSGIPPPSLPSSTKPKSNLPASLTTFIGRTKEQADVISLLGKQRLVTLTGAGGVGKTRLSIKIGEQLLRIYIDGIWLVEFAPILDPLLVPRSTAIAIGLRDEPQHPVIDMLCDYLQRKQMLIILDNCEHLLDACAQLAVTLLKHCPDLKILATSREAMSVLGEAVYPVPPLELPDIRMLVDRFRDYDSIRLFQERAQLARVNFSLTIENISSVARICTQLDGIPLAIELAAARVSTVSIEEIAVRLQESLRLLTTGNRTALPRHQTLQAAIDWSYNLLSQEEQNLFQRLSVFIDGWTLEAATSICSDDNIASHTIFDLLTQLIKKSLIVTQEIKSKTRYRMLETIRQYANNRLRESGGNDRLRDSHLEYFLKLAETAEPHLLRVEQLEWLVRLYTDYENVRAALEWALSKNPPELSLRLCAALGTYWYLRAYWMEGSTWLTKALSKSSQHPDAAEKASRVRALYQDAHLADQLGDLERLKDSADLSLLLAQEGINTRDIAIARLYVGISQLRHGNNDDSALRLIRESLSDFQKTKDLYWEAYSYNVLNLYLLVQPDLSFFEENSFVQSLEFARKVGERSNWAEALITYSRWLFLFNRVVDAKKYTEQADLLLKQIGSIISSPSHLLASIAWFNHDYQEAISLYVERQEYLALLGEKNERSKVIENLGLIALEQGELDRAQAYLEEALEMAREAKDRVATMYRLVELGTACYLRGNSDEGKQYFREGFPLAKGLVWHQITYILSILVYYISTQELEISAYILGTIDHWQREHKRPTHPLWKRYYDRAVTHGLDTLGNVAFEAAFAEGQKMSLDDALNLALKTVDGM